MKSHATWRRPLLAVALGLGWGCSAGTTGRTNSSSVPLTVGPADCGFTMPDSSPIYGESQVDDPPVVVGNGARMDYPPELRTEGIAGQVVVSYVIDSYGRTVRPSVKVVRSTHPGFEESAMEVVRGAMFKPGKLRGGEVAVCVHQAINFVLD